MVVCFIQIYSTLGIGAARDMTGNGQFNSIWFNSRQIDSRINIKLYVFIFCRLEAALHLYQCLINIFFLSQTTQ